MDSIKEGQVYVHRNRPERIIQVLSTSESKAEVVYLNTTDDKNRGLIAELFLLSINRMYDLNKVQAPSWEV